MRIGRSLPPAAAPITLRNILSGFAGAIAGQCEINRFQQELAAYHQVNQCYLVSSGKAAMTVILMALKRLYPDRDEVLIPAYTCYSIPAAIVRAGLKIRICDLDSDTLDFDYSDLERQLASSSKILCVIPTHLFGIIADIQRLKTLLGTHGPFILEDAAQAMGESTETGMVGALGDVGILSLGRGKVFSTVGGGVILTKNQEIGREIRHIIDALPRYSLLATLKLVCYALVLCFFMRPSLYWIPMALPFLGLGETHFDPEFPILRLTPFQAGLSRRWQQTLPGLQRLRQANAASYVSAGVTCPAILTHRLQGHIRFPAYVPQAVRPAIFAKSVAAGLGVSLLYPTTVAGIPGIKKHLVGGTAINAESIVAKLISLPVHSWVGKKDIAQIVTLLDEQAEGNWCN